MDYIDFQEFIKELETKDIKKIATKPIIEFMNTIGWYYDEKLQMWVQAKHAKNSLKWLQKFLNGDDLEVQLLKLNPNYLSFIGDDHGKLSRGSSGKAIPDFNVKLPHDSNALLKHYTLDSKTYMFSSNILDTVSFLTLVSSFHKAKIVLAFCMDTCSFYWIFRIGDTDSYAKPRLFKDLSAVEQDIVKDIKLPDTVKMLRIEVPSDATDADLPEEASYIFTEYKVIKN
jgi:hypothetical protein